ncbi:MAG: circularly permuted type 2 ATP-grasp protein [Alphaproteobacteria bacterium]
MKGFDGICRGPYAQVAEWLATASPDSLNLKRHEAELLFRRIGITFAVYGEGGNPERLIPYDLIPRILAESEWNLMARGLEQRVKALNAFVRDCYHDRDIIRAGRIPERLVLHDDSFVPEMQGFDVPGDVYCHIAGIDMVRVSPDEFYVLEDNCRTPSGVSYMLENREMSLRLLPELVGAYDLMSVSQYPEELLDSLMSVPPPNCPAEPTVAILTPGSLNSAYYEHSFLADEMGIELVEGVDLIVEDAVLYMRTTQGLRRVDVLYRRIDDDFLDPLTFRPESVLGVPGLMAVYRAGNLTLANAVGAGIADNKAVYIYVPEMVRFYLGEEPILSNVPTHNCAEPDELAYVLDHIGELVVKETHGSGGYGMLVGPRSTRAEQEAFAAKLKAHPAAYIAQPTLALSTCPTFVDEGVAPRHVDLRPFVLTGRETRIVPGGLTRVALREGSLVVNSSQGGGTKDTWVVRDPGGAAG